METSSGTSPDVGQIIKLIPRTLPGADAPPAIELVRLAQAYNQIADPVLRGSVLTLVEHMARAAQQD